MSPKPPSAPDHQPLEIELRKDLSKQLLMFLPMFLIGMFGAWLKDRIGNHPETILFIIIPGIVLQILILWRWMRRPNTKLGLPFLVFLPIYILCFYFVAETDLLDWRRTLVGYESAVPRNLLALNRFGDWHYRFARRESALPNLAVVLMKPPATVTEGRLDVADLLSIALDSGARGVALDYYFVKHEPENIATDRAVDDYLCSRLEDARKHDVKVFIAYDFRVVGDHIDSLPIDPGLAACVTKEQLGHMIGYAERDGLVRSIPAYFWHDPALESLSLKIAKSLDSSVKVPQNGLLQFTQPQNDFPTILFDELNQPGVDRLILHDRFILAGEDSAADSFQTPFGVKPGVIVHAYAVQSLVRNRFIERPPWWSSLLMISILCYLNIVLIAWGLSGRRLVLVNACVSVLVVGCAIMAMRFWLVWIDLVYPVLATWIFLIILSAIKRFGKRKTPATADVISSG